MMLPDNASLDRKVRWVIMSSYLYYRRGDALIVDGYYDRLVRELVKNWSRIDQFRQWQLNSPEELSATGHHIKITMFAEAGAISWYKQCKKIEPPGGNITETEWHNDIRCKWATAEPVGFLVKREKPKKEVILKPTQLSLF